MAAGQEFQLQDGSTLKVQLVKKFTTTELQVLRNGQPLPGSASDPEARLKTAYGMVFFIAGLNIVLGLAAGIFQVEFLQSIGISFYSIIFGVVFLVLGYFVQRRSAVALVIAIAVFALDGILGLVTAISQGYDPGAGGTIARIFLLIPMIQGVGAIRAIKKQ